MERLSSVPAVHRESLRRQVIKAEIEIRKFVEVILKNQSDQADDLINKMNLAYPSLTGDVLKKSSTNLIAQDSQAVSHFLPEFIHSFNKNGEESLYLILNVNAENFDLKMYEKLLEKLSLIK